MQYIGFLIAAVVVGIDRLTKWLVVNNFGLMETMPVIKINDVEVLNISYYLNDGAAFSRFKGKTTILIAFTSIVLAVFIVMLLLKKTKKMSYIVSFGLIIGGGIGNLIDRLFNNGLVVDFIDVRIINFAIFNVADICAVCGTILFILVVLTEDIGKKRKAKKSVEEQKTSADESEAPLDVSEEANGND